KDLVTKRGPRAEARLTPVLDAWRILWLSDLDTGSPSSPPDPTPSRSSFRAPETRTQKRESLQVTCMAQTLFVGGLSFCTTSDGLCEFFTQSGTVGSATVVTDQFSGRSKGFGFVEMESNEQAQNAVSHLNGRDLDGRSIKVEVAKPKTEGRRDSGRGGYGGNRGGGGGGGGGRPERAPPPPHPPPPPPARRLLPVRPPRP